MKTLDKISGYFVFVVWFFTAVMIQTTSFAADSKSRQALEFDGNSGFLTAKLSSSLTADLTLEAWISTTAAPPVQERILSVAGSQGALQLCINGGRIIVDNSGGPVKGISGTGGCNDGQWHHVVVKRYEKTTYALHVDGELAGVCEGTTPSYDSIYIGNAPGYGPFNGLIDEVRVYDRCLTDLEVLSNYNETQPIISEGLVGWWKLDGDLNDSVGAAHCKATGTPKWIAGRGTALYDRSRLRCRFHPAAGKVHVEIDSRQMGDIPADARWEATLLNRTGSVVSKQTSPVLPTLKGSLALQATTTPPGEYETRVRVVAPNGKPVGQIASEKVTLTQRPEWTRKVKVLNNLVMELLNVGDRMTSEKSFTFTNPRAGWLFFSATPAAALKAEEQVELSVAMLTGNISVLVCSPEKGTPCEAMRYLPSGDYRLAVRCKGKAALSRLIVRAMPEIIYAEFGDNPKVKGFGSYNREFLQRIGLLNNVNTIEGDANFDNKADPYHEEWQREGKRWLAERTIGKEETPEAQYQFWMLPFTTTQPFADGILIDEFMDFTPFRNEAVSKLLADPRYKGKLFYPYVCSPHPHRGGDEAIKFMRLIMDSGNRVAWERYMEEQRNEKEALSYLDMCILQELEKYWLPSLPDAVGHTILCFGNYLSAPPSTLNSDPSVDFKVWMDMQYNLIATDPWFFGLYGLMEWSSGYADEEAVRWVAKLYRHYGIEGKTELLSRSYGFNYRLPHLQNPDFADGLKGWEVKPAEQGSIAPRKFDGFSSLQGRYPPSPKGDAFAWMKQSSKAPNLLSQEIKDLVPGRLYSVKLITGDYRELTNGKSGEKKHAVQLRVDNVDLVPDKCLVTVMQGSNWAEIKPFDAKNPFWINYHRLVFRAKARAAKLAISDWTSQNGPDSPLEQELAVNFVEVQPYLED